ncbi:MAG: tetratricopeptide repeat protein, partial [Candidatus Acidiferrales bacterium]
RALSNLGGVLVGKGRFDDAIAAVNKALQLEPDDASLHHTLGLALRQAGKKKEARREFAKAQQLDPRFKSPEPQ